MFCLVKCWSDVASYVSYLLLGSKPVSLSMVSQYRIGCDTNNRQRDACKQNMHRSLTYMIGMG